MKILVSYAHETGHVLPDGPFLQIRDAILETASLDETAIGTIRAHLVGKVHTPVSIIAITQLETP